MGRGDHRASAGAAQQAKHADGATASQRREPAAPFDRDYWVCHSEGFRVDAADGRIGFVEDVDTDVVGAPLLHIRAGLLGRRVLVVPASSVEFVVPRAGRLWLHSPIAIHESRAA